MPFVLQVLPVEVLVKFTVLFKFSPYDAAIWKVEKSQKLFGLHARRELHFWTKFHGGIQQLSRDI